MSAPFLLEQSEVKRLENWGITPLPASPYTPPECQPRGLCGNVYGDYRFDDGDSVTTSEIVSVKLNGETALVTTRTGSQYLLGEVDPEYERAYPKARERFIQQFSIRKATLGSAS